MDDTSRPRRVLIVGAGIAGLSAAVSLANIGWHPILIERATTRRRGGYLIFFRGNAPAAADKLGIRHLLADRLTPESRWWEADRTGRLHPGMRPPRTVGRTALTLMRGDLEHALHTAAQNIAEIHYGQTPTTIEETDDTVHVTTSEGLQFEVDLLIGADGVHSAVRAACFGPPARYRKEWDHVVAAFIVKRPLPWLPCHHTVVHAEAGRSAWVTGFTPHPVTYLLYRTSEAATDLNRNPTDVLRDVFAGAEGHIPDLLDALNDAENPLFDQLCQIHMPRWHTGRTMLLGDSAWCTTLYSAYGSALALEASVALASALDTEADISSALNQWENSVRPTVLRHQQQAHRMQRLFLPTNTAARRLRSAAIRLSHLPGGARLANFLIPQPV